MRDINRRQFLCSSAAALGGALCPQWGWAFKSGPQDIRGKVFKGDAPKTLWKWNREGFLYQKLSKKKVICGICPNRCVLAPGDRSVCRSKINRDGILYSLTYGNPCAVNIDPIEKKPLFHFWPTSSAFSIATTGCNFRCLNCQNWEISQAKPDEVRQYELFPAEVVTSARKSDSISIAYTYSEAITFFEYMLETARLANANGIHNLLISNGYINKKPLLELCKVLDAANINLKSFSNEIYKKLNGGRLKPVLNALKTMHANDVHLEITNLLVPGYTDNEEMAKQMCGWILENLGPDYPLHFLRFFPRYKLDRLAPTPVSTLVRFRSLAIQEGMRYVYIGNVPGHEGAHTYCHHCRKLLVERQGFFIPLINLKGNKCKFCDTIIPGVWGSKI